MQKFQTIFDRAASRHGGEEAFAEKLAAHYYGTDLTAVQAPKGDDRWLAEFTKRVFQAGFSWKVVEAKWDGFEEAFWGFDPVKCAQIDMEDMERLTSDKGIIRNPGKIQSVIQNADMIMHMSLEKGSADAFIRSWPAEDFFGLLTYLNKHGSRLGPNTACYALRFSGVPSFILSNDVTAALIHAGIIDKAPTSKSAKKAVQTAFNHWMGESGENLSYISRVLAHSMDS